MSARERARRVAEIRDRIEGGGYQIPAEEVASAIWAMTNQAVQAFRPLAH